MKIPPNLAPTHQYRFTRALTFEFNSEYTVIRITLNGEVIADWDYPTTIVNLDQFELLPPDKPRSRLESCYDLLARKGNLVTILIKWRRKLSNTDYLELMDDLHFAILKAESDYSTAMHKGANPEKDLTEIINRLISF